MALRRFATTVDGTIPVPALLYDDEDLFASQDSVGIYDGHQKAANHQSGSVHVSSHRLFFVNSHQPALRSFSLDLAHITRTDYYAGLFMSSPKVTLCLDSTFIPPSNLPDDSHDGLGSWVCGVCGHRNPPGLSPAAARICALCGVPRSALSDSPRPNASTLSVPQLAASVSVALSTQARSPTPPLSRAPSTVACTACTFLNHPTLRSCEMCSTPLPLAPGNLGLGSKSAPSSRPISPSIEDGVSDSTSPLIKLSFRKGGDRAFYATLRRALKARAWEGRQIGKGARSGTASLGANTPDGGGATPGLLRRSGIDGILHHVETSAQDTETQLSDAFQDLEGLMVKARDLVGLAAELNAKMGASGGGSGSGSASPRARVPDSVSSSGLFTTTALVPSSEPEEARFIRSSMAQLGVQLSNAPVTADMVQDERRWVDELARELGRVLQGSVDEGGRQTGGLMKERGIVGLDEVWGGWNRARGVALVGPATFLQAVHALPVHTSPPIRNRVFRSGLQVLHTPPYTHAAFAARLSSYLAISGRQTTSEVAREEAITISLGAEMILAVEADGVICRDDERSAIRGGGAELGWAVNGFEAYVWDGEP